MINLLRRNIIFIGLSLMLIIALGLALLCVPKGELHIFLCNRHIYARDIFYRYYTKVAEWFPYAACILLLLFRRIGDGLFATAAMLTAALTTQLLKHIVNAPRPVIWFDENLPDISLPLVNGVQMNHFFSFPSGHTSSFFALAFVLCIILSMTHRATKRQRITGVILQVILFFLAALGGYSRIYLSQHFALDVFAGIIIALVITALFYVLFNRFESTKWYNYRFFSKK